MSVDYIPESLRGNLEAEIIALEAAALVPELHEKLRVQLREIFEELFPDDSLDMAKACIDVLAESAKSSAAANDHSVPVHAVYRRTERLKDQACDDDEVRSLLIQICKNRGDINAHV